MRRIAVNLQFEQPDGSVREFRDQVEVDGRPSDRGEQKFATELFEYARVELNWDKHLADVKITTAPTQGVAGPVVADVSHIGEIFNGLNRQELWMEIQNTLYEVAYCFAQAKAYKDVEPKVDEIDKWYPAHARKMFGLNTGALYLAKIQDLVVRLLFESLGGPAFIKVDITRDDWERALTMDNAKPELRRLRLEDVLTESEYQKILAALNEPAKSHNQKLVVTYRNCIAHRIRPSVDHPELSPVIQDRLGKKILDESGKPKATQWVVKSHATKAEFEFDVLYAAMVDYLGHVKNMLEKLNAIPRFS